MKKTKQKTAKTKQEYANYEPKKRQTKKATSRFRMLKKTTQSGREKTTKRLRKGG